MSAAFDQTNPRSTIQGEINFQLSPAGRKMRTFVVRDRTGDCIVPGDVHIQFINCIFTSFYATEGNNNFSFDSCEFDNPNEQFFMKNCSFKSKNCRIKSELTLEQAKGELLNAIVTGRITVASHSFLRSSHSRWNGQDQSYPSALLLRYGSKVSSEGDVWMNWPTLVWHVRDGSVVQALQPRFAGNDRGLIVAEASTVTLVDCGDIKAAQQPNTVAFTVSKNASIDIVQVQELFCAYGLVKAIGTTEKPAGSVRFRNPTKLVGSNGSLITLGKGGRVEFSGNYILKTPAEIAVLDGATAVFTGSFALEGSIRLRNNSDLCIKGSSTSTFKNPNGKAIIAEAPDTGTARSIVLCHGLLQLLSSIDSVIATNYADVIIQQVGFIKGSGGSSVILHNSKTCMSNIKQVDSGNGSGIESYNSSIVLRDIETVTGTTTGLSLLAKTNGVFDRVGVISGSSSGVTVDDSTAVVKNSTRVTGSAGVGVGVYNGSTVSLANINEIHGALQGIAANTGLTGNSLSVYNVLVVDGDEVAIWLNNTDFMMDGVSTSLVKSSAKGISLNSSKEGAYKATLRGPITVSAPTALSSTNYQLDDTGVSWNGRTEVSGAIWSSKFAANTETSNLRQVVAQHIRVKNEKTVSITEKSEYTGNRNIITGKLDVRDSMVSAKLSQIGGIAGLNSSTIRSLMSSIGGAYSATDSAVEALQGRVGDITQTGRTGILGVGLKTGSVAFAADSTAANPVSILTAGGGSEETLFLQSDYTVKLEGNQLTEELRSNILRTSPSDWKVQVGELSMIELTSTMLTLRAASILSETS